MHVFQRKFGFAFSTNLIEMKLTIASMSAWIGVK